MAIGEQAVLSPAFPAPVERTESALKSDAKLDHFLADVEKRAYRMARFAIGDADEALDITQDTMIRLATKYGDKPEGEWPALFYRILQNRIRDHQRRQSVRQRVMAWAPPPNPDREGRETDPIEAAPDQAPDILPERLLELGDAREAIDAAVAALPRRQQQTFLLRAWEGMDVADTARAMGCSEGSVKTHYSRALRALRVRLEEHHR
ncbi:MAG: RNA polymerase sigma factor [Pseudomonadota bacterium]